MVTIDAAAESHDGVTLVTATVETGDTPVRISIASQLDGPVWPPRRQGEPAAGWTDDGFEGVVPAEGSLSLGFASPAAPVDPPLELVAAEPADEPTDAMDTPAAVLRGLGDPSPPSLIEPEHDVEAAASTSTVHAAASTSTVHAAASTNMAEADDSLDDGTTTVAPLETSINEGNGATTPGRPSTPDACPPNDSLPPAVADWLEGIESRVEVAEALSADASVDRAVQALRDCGGVEGAREIDDRLSADAERLRAVEERVATLAERAEAASVAREALDRLV